MVKILIVDDSAFARHTLKIIVENGGHEIIGFAENGEQALSQFKSLGPELVMLDYLMVGKSGMEVLSEIIQYDPDAKVIMVSGVGDSDIEEQALGAGAKFFVRKSYAHTNILRIIEQVMQD